MKRFGYAKWQEIDDEIRKKQKEEDVLGKIEDGYHECEVVVCDKLLIIKCGQRILSCQMDGNLLKLVRWATGFSRPAGGMMVAEIVKGKIVSVGKDDA